MAEWNVYYDSFFFADLQKAEDAKLRCRSFHQQNFSLGCGGMESLIHVPL